MTTLQTADKVLKDYYLDVIQEQMNKGMGVFYSMIDKTSEYVYGKDVRKILSCGGKNYLSALDENFNKVEIELDSQEEAKDKEKMKRFIDEVRGKEKEK